MTREEKIAYSRLIGPGGINCPCCNQHMSKKELRRLARKRIKKELNREINYYLEDLNLERTSNG